MNMQAETVNKMSAIDRALEAAKARKAAKDAEVTNEDSYVMSTTITPKTPKEPKGNDPDREARSIARAAQREERLAAKAVATSADRAAKILRKAARAAKRLEKTAVKSRRSSEPAHMKKVERARSKCPPMNIETEKFFNEAIGNFSAAQIDSLAQHLLVHNRAYKTQRASESTPFQVGTVVTITGGETKYIGMNGVVTKSQKLRTTVAVEGMNNPLYVYTADAKIADIDTEQLSVAV